MKLWIHKHPLVSVAHMPRKVRRGMRSIASCNDGTSPVRKVERLLGINPVAARIFLGRYVEAHGDAKPVPAKVVAFNHTPLEETTPDGTISINRPFRNAAKRERCARRAVAL